MLKNGQMTDVGENVGQFSVKLSLELNMIETNRFFSAERRGPWDRVGHKNDRRELGNVKKGSIPRRFPTIFKYGKATSGLYPLWHVCLEKQCGVTYAPIMKVACEYYSSHCYAHLSNSHVSVQNQLCGQTQKKCPLLNDTSKKMYHSWPQVRRLTTHALICYQRLVFCYEYAWQQ